MKIRKKIYMDKKRLLKYTISVIQGLAHSFICCALFDSPSFIIKMMVFCLYHLNKSLEFFQIEDSVILILVIFPNRCQIKRVHWFEHQLAR